MVDGMAEPCQRHTPASRLSPSPRHGQGGKDVDMALRENYFWVDKNS
jgi:hypothetical protein